MNIFKMLPNWLRIALKTFIFAIWLSTIEYDCAPVRGLSAWFNIPFPYALEDDRKLPDLSKHPNCTVCPRVFFPVCANNGVTYLNYCVLNCLSANRTIRFYRYGECVLYRRSNEHVVTLVLHKSLAKNETIQSRAFEDTAFEKNNVTFYTVSYTMSNYSS